MNDIHGYIHPVETRENPIWMVWNAAGEWNFPRRGREEREGSYGLLIREGARLFAFKRHNRRLHHPHQLVGG